MLIFGSSRAWSSSPIFLFFSAFDSPVDDGHTLDTGLTLHFFISFLWLFVNLSEENQALDRRKVSLSAMVPMMSPKQHQLVPWNALKGRRCDSYKRVELASIVQPHVFPLDNLTHSSNNNKYPLLGWIHSSAPEWWIPADKKFPNNSTWSFI